VGVAKHGPAAPRAEHDAAAGWYDIPAGRPLNTVVMHPARPFGNTAPQSAWATGPTVDQPSYDR